MKKDYASPTHKLLAVFKQGRDKWKEKAIATKKELKLCKNRIVFLEESKEKFKGRSKELKAIVTQLKSEIVNLQSQLNSDRQSNDIKKRNKVDP